MNFYDFLKDLQNRKFFKEISIYAIAAWIIIQVAATTFPHIGFPDYWVTIIIVLCLIGLPIWMLLSWRYNFFDDGAATIEEKTSKDLKSNISSQFKSLILGVSIIVFLLSG